MLIVRVWLEEHAEAPLRAVITRVSDVTEEERSMPLSASSPDDVLAIVEAWLDGLLPSREPRP